MSKNSSPKEKYTPRHRRPNIEQVLSTYADRIKGVDPACSSVANIGARDFDNLVDSIRSRGLLTPVLIDKNGFLVDGRCRLGAMHVLGLPLTDDDVDTTNTDPEAIAESNVARRHLTAGQKIMRATELLAKEREAASLRRRQGAEKGRKNRNRPHVAKPVTGNPNEKRRPSSVDKISKQEGVSREDLKRAEQIKIERPDIAVDLVTGEAKWEDVKLIGENTRRPAKRPKQPAPDKKPKQNVASTNGSKKTFNDQLTRIRDRDDGIRIIDCGDVLVFLHVDLESSVLAYRDGADWWYGPADAKEHTHVESVQEARRKCLSILKSRLAKPSASTCDR